MMDRSISADSRRARRMLQTSRFVVYLILVFLSVMCLFSFYMLIINATRSNADLQGGFRIVPSDQFFINLKNAWTDASIDIPRGMLNSFFIASGMSFGSARYITPSSPSTGSTTLTAPGCASMNLLAISSCRTLAI